MFPADMWVVVGSSLVVAVLLYAVLYAWQRETVRTAIIAAVANFLFFNFDGLYHHYLGSNLPVFLALTLLIVLGTGFALRRLPERSVQATGSILRITALVLLAIQVYM